MGICGTNGLTPEEKARQKQQDLASRKLDKMIAKDQESQMQTIKLLLLGAGESGKSTLFKALITIYGTGYDDDALMGFVPTVRGNAISSMITLLHHSKTYGPPESEEAKASAAWFDDSKDDGTLQPETVKHIKILWADPGIQKTYENRSSFQLVDSAKYFFDAIDRISVADYLPSQDDILRCRIRTTGITETAFKIDGNEFKMFDVGGQRNERKKWIHCFEDVTAVIFVAALSEYDQVLFEDEEQNRMVEALNLFDNICNSPWFSSVAMLLFLNKRDLFREKIDRVPLSVCAAFSDYQGSGYDDGVAYIQNCYLEKNKNTEKEVYCHITCATDTTNVNAVFDAVKDIIIRESLRDAGLV